MKNWGTQGKMNPFNEVYDLVFQMTVRMATCRELSEDKEVVNRLAKNYWDIEKKRNPHLHSPSLVTKSRSEKKTAGD